MKLDEIWVYEGLGHRVVSVVTTIDYPSVRGTILETNWERFGKVGTTETSMDGGGWTFLGRLCRSEGMEPVQVLVGQRWRMDRHVPYQPGARITTLTVAHFCHDKLIHGVFNHRFVNGTSKVGRVFPIDNTRQDVEVGEVWEWRDQEHSRRVVARVTRDRIGEVISASGWFEGTYLPGSQVTSIGSDSLWTKLEDAPVPKRTYRVTVTDADSGEVLKTSEGELFDGDKSIEAYYRLKADGLGLGLDTVKELTMERTVTMRIEIR